MASATFKYVPQTAATIFAYSSVCFFFYGLHIHPGHVSPEATPFQFLACTRSTHTHTPYTHTTHTHTNTLTHTLQLRILLWLYTKKCESNKLVPLVTFYITAKPKEDLTQPPPLPTLPPSPLPSWSHFPDLDVFVSIITKPFVKKQLLYSTWENYVLPKFLSWTLETQVRFWSWNTTAQLAT